jgi:hypothetical protein
MSRESFFQPHLIGQMPREWIGLPICLPENSVNTFLFHHILQF